MRTKLGTAVAGLLSGVDCSLGIAVTDAERECILAAADMVTLARTAVDATIAAT